MPSALIIDNGDYTSLAELLGRQIKVGYYSPWANSAPLSRLIYPGAGLEGVTRVNDPLQFLEKSTPDVVIFPHLYHHDLERAVRSMGIPCFGPGAGAILETDRWFLKEFLAKHDLSVGYSVEILGIDALGQYLQNPKYEDKYVKVSVFRGDMNTYHHKSWKQTSLWFANLSRLMGPIGREMRFIVEDPIPDALEITIEGFFIDGTLLEPFMVGLEIKDAGEFGFYCDSQDKLPKTVCNILAAVAEFFTETEYRNFFALEIRMLKDGEAFLTDATCRVPIPPGAVIAASTKNFVELIMAGAAGEAVKPDVGDTKFLAEIELKSTWAVKDFLPVYFPREIADNVALFSHCKIDDDYWIIPHVPEDDESDNIGSVFCFGQSPESCEQGCKDVAEQIEAERLTYNSEVLAKAQEQLTEAAKLGIKP